MGQVHGVYLKYVGLSALSYAAYHKTLGGGELSSLLSSVSTSGTEANTDLLLQTGVALYWGYSTILNGVIAVMFKMNTGMGFVGKDRESGQIPFWSYFLFAPFHIPTWVYTTVSHKKDKYPAATEVQDGWWVGGRYAHELDVEKWAAVIDMTVEFPESCRNITAKYLSLPYWDGVPASPKDLEFAASLATEAHKEGPVLVHCAHGRGRSTTVMVACLVKAGLYENWKDAFEKGIKPHRPCCKLNSAMRANLEAWQQEYVNGPVAK